jgi:hypothetical protein
VPGSLLRNSREAILRGAFWECLAHEGYRDRAEVVHDKKWDLEGTRRNILNCFDYIFQANPHLAATLEQESASIFDIISRTKLERA